MSKNAVSILGQYQPGQLPAHLAAAVQDVESNIADRQTVPSLSYEGKVWTVILNGEKKRLNKRNEDGEVEPLQIFKGVILDYAKKRGRAYYEGAYDPNKVSAPKCWSEDGVTPHASVPDETRQSHKCEGCPMAAKGSKITEQGKSSTACSQHRMIVVIPAGKYDFEPLRMKLAITSDWDANSPEHEQQGWYAFSQYLDQFRAQKVPHTGLCVTKFKFDPNMAFPKVLFGADRWLTEEEISIVKPLWTDERVKALLGGAWTPAGGDGVKTLPSPSKASTAPAAAPAKAAKPAPAPAEDEEEAPAPKAKAAKAPEKAVQADDDDWGMTTPAKPAKAAQKAPAKAKAASDDDGMELDEAPAKPKAKAKPAPVVDEETVVEEVEDAGPEMLRPKAAAAPAAKGADPALESLLEEWD